ncbi:MAG: hypothetical protein IIA44_16260, partial [Acidobacteria bacterium]|nr:hypothetical protein [Acidobacteriota bacterium]
MTPNRLLLSASAPLIALVPLLLSAPATAAQQSSAGAVVLDSAFLAGYRWRNIGPDRGGRSIAVAGVKGRPSEAYFGAVGGGLWKTTDSGENWAPVTDFQINSASVGAVAVSDTDPDLVFIGTGETCIRGNILPGDGVYRSRDGGETWQHVGFSQSHGISKIRIHPLNPDIVFVASFGKYGAPSEERGVFKSTDGGDTWERVLYRNDETGAIDIVIDQNNPDVLYASLWEAYRKEYQMSSGGPGSGMFKSTDGGETWTEMTRNPGMPQEGLVGRIGLAVSPANSDRVYALFENDDGGLFSSDDAGETWTLVNDARAIRQRAFYYTHVFADPMDEDVVYMQNTSFFRSSDGKLFVTHTDNDTLLPVEVSLLGVENVEGSGVDRIEFKLDGSPAGDDLISPASPVNPEVVGIAVEGAHVLRHRAIDNIGNTEVLRSLAFVFDATPPVTQSIGRPPTFTASTNELYLGASAFAPPAVTLAVSDGSGSGVKSTVFRTASGGTLQNYTLGSLITFAGEGEKFLEFFSTDFLDVEELPVQPELRVDLTPPVLSVEPSPGAQTFTSGGITFVAPGTPIDAKATDPLLSDSSGPGSGALAVSASVDGKTATESVRSGADLSPDHTLTVTLPVTEGV